MGLLDHARDVLIERCAQSGVDLAEPVSVEPLTPEDAVGEPPRLAGPPLSPGCEFAIKAGRERVIEAVFRSARGQAFTDAPSSFHGPLEEALNEPLFGSRQRAVCVAAINAVLRALGGVAGTVHCRDEDPVRCGPELARLVEERFGRVRVGLVGMQPAILAALVERFGAPAVHVVDLADGNVGRVVSGVEVWDGAVDLRRLVDACDVALVTGSSLVNGSIDILLPTFRHAGKPTLFYGNTVSGAAALLGLDRVCPFSC